MDSEMFFERFYFFRENNVHFSIMFIFREIIYFISAPY